MYKSVAPFKTPRALLIVRMCVFPLTKIKRSIIVGYTMKQKTMSARMVYLIPKFRSKR